MHSFLELRIFIIYIEPINDIYSHALSGEWLMIVCVCKRVSDRQIRQLVDEGANSLRDIRKATGLGTQCGKCACEARQMVRELSGHDGNSLLDLAALAYELPSAGLA